MILYERKNILYCKIKVYFKTNLVIYGFVLIQFNQDNNNFEFGKNIYCKCTYLHLE